MKVNTISTERPYLEQFKKRRCCDESRKSSANIKIDLWVLFNADVNCNDWRALMEGEWMSTE